MAFALIKAKGLDDTARARVQREAQAMGQVLRTTGDDVEGCARALGKKYWYVFFAGEVMGGLLSRI